MNQDEMLIFLKELDRKYQRVVYENLSYIIKRKQYNNMMYELMLLASDYMELEHTSNDKKDVCEEERQSIKNIATWLEPYFIIEILDDSYDDNTASAIKSFFKLIKEEY